VLLLAGATAVAGMAVLPASAGEAAPAAAPVRPVAALSVAAPSAAAEVALVRALRAGAAASERSRAERDRAPRRAARASRDRTRPAAATQAAPTRPAARERPPAPPAHVRPGSGRLTSDFGHRWGRLHAGIDLAAGTGSPISAVTAGTVLSAGAEGGYGNVVRLQHVDDTITLYAHLSAVLVTAGDRVPAGHVLGREGSSGRSTGPHLHFEVRVGGRPVDPAAWLRARGVAL